MAMFQGIIKGTKCLVLGFLACSIFTPSATAFRLKTHLWIGQSVINELVASTNLSINGMAFSVDPAVREAILSHPDSYLAGCLGPDIVPDLVVGQMTTHPGIEGGWRSRQWLSHVLSGSHGDAKSRAFALGYLSHAASDVFAHTYVNTYAGDIFILTDEQEVEQRHFAIESFIDRALPPINGISDYSKSFSFPKSFVVSQLISSKAVQKEYAHGDALAGHLVLMVTVRNAVDELREQLRRIETELAGVIADVRKRLGDAQKELAVASGPVAQLELQIKANQEVVNAYKSALKAQRDAVSQAERGVSDAIDALARINGQLNDAQNRLRDARNKLIDEANKLLGIPEKLSRTITKEIVEKLPWPLKDLVKKVTEVVFEANPAYGAQKRIVDEVKNLINSLESQVTDLVNKRASEEARRLAQAAAKATAEAAIASLAAQQKVVDEAKATLSKLRAELQPLKEKEAEIMKKVAEIQSNLAFFLAAEAVNLKPLSNLALIWLKNIDRAMEEYIGASEASARNLIAKHNPLDPYLDWYSCWKPVFIGVPKEVSTAPCLVKEEVEKLQDMLNQLRSELHKQLGDAAWLVDPAGKAEIVVREKLVPELKKGAIDLLGQIAGDRTKQMAKLLLMDVDDKTLVESFTGSTKKGLVEFPDIVARLRHDLHIGASGQLDPDLFFALRNAVILSKITLLNEAGMDKLHKDFKIKRSWFAKSRPGVDALLTGVLSLDGNHQWRHATPPYIRRSGVQKPDPKLPYAEKDSGNDLFRIVPADRPNRQAIFFGPLVPSIEEPGEGGFKDVRPEKYRYDPSHKNPFP